MNKKERVMMVMDSIPGPGKALRNTGQENRFL
jgi:hypothetical protein